MNKERKLNTLIVITSIIVTLCGVGCVYGLFAADGLHTKIDCLIELIAAFAGLAYLIKGCHKDAAKYYRLFMFMYAFSYIADNFGVIFDPNIVTEYSAIEEILTLILFGNTLVLATGSDLGKKVSYSLCVVNMIIYLFYLIYAIAVYIPSFTLTSSIVTACVLFLTWLLLSFMMFVMTIIKYNEKELRGAK